VGKEKNIDHDGEPLKRDLIGAALCHKSRNGKWMMYTIVEHTSKTPIANARHLRVV